jgi:hypothetical protein
MRLPRRNGRGLTPFQDLRLKSCVINRAPVMMAWSMLIAERMHFSRAEALSIGTFYFDLYPCDVNSITASVYTEMNAVTKGVSLGIYKADEERGREATKDGSQPYVELIGRKYVLLDFNEVPDIITFLQNVC